MDTEDREEPTGGVRVPLSATAARKVDAAARRTGLRRGDAVAAFAGARFRLEGDGRYVAFRPRLSPAGGAEGTGLGG